ncbi:MAG: hypothetical protein LBL34_04850 [Clostridiales bacterium]|jgi:cellobiose phosphorylase|nr:hypothetical protein [Clostridiales bacterium]
MEFFNGYGGFSDTGREYIIGLKEGESTPAPYSNVIANEHFGTIVTESGGGFTWCGNSRECKITEWCNDPITDEASEVISIADNGEKWRFTDGEREVRHGFGYTQFRSVRNGVEVNADVFVPVRQRSKVTLLRLKNTSNSKRKLNVEYEIRPVLGVSAMQTAMHIHAEQRGNSIVLHNNYSKELGDGEVFMTSDHAIGEWWKRQGLAGFVVGVELGAGEEKELVLELNCERRDALTAEQAGDELKKARKFWADVADRTAVKTGDKAADIMMGGWLVYQTISCRLWARTSFYQCGGAYGFRDQLQDSISLLDSFPEIARRQILKACAHQFTEGDVQHWWHEGRGREPSAGDKGVRTRFTDDLLWLPYCVAEYVRAVKSTSILREWVSFIESAPLAEGELERYETPKISDETGEVYEHCLRAIEHSLQFGAHGLPLMGGGDWNDGMNKVGIKGQGESVWLGWFLYDVLTKFAFICDSCGEREQAERYGRIAEELKRNIDRNAWDGAWFKRAFYDDGSCMGASKNAECEIDSIAQSWAVISGAGERDKCNTAVDSALEKLVDWDAGIIKLLDPPFENGEQNPGYIKSYIAGVRENGGQYTHASAWLALACHRLGRTDTARKLFSLMNPINHADTREKADKYRVEPYVAAADVYSSPERVGMGGWSWYTGAAGWLYTVGKEIFS